MKNKLSLLLMAIFALILFVACGSDDDETAHSLDIAMADEAALDLPMDIALFSREEGSGARSAFEALVGVNQEEDQTDLMRAAAIIEQGNGAVLSAVRNTVAGIGYISFASYVDAGDTLRGLYINDAAPTIENMLAGDYALVREFNFVYVPDNMGDIETAFIEFSQSIEGIAILQGVGAVVNPDGAESFDTAVHGALTGTSSFGGSTSTETTALALINEFTAMFPGVEITYDATGSGAGITGAIEGNYSLGFASREIRDSELDKGINAVTYCLDGLVVVVNQANDVTGMTIENLKSIWLGDITTWSSIR